MGRVYPAPKAKPEMGFADSFSRASKRGTMRLAVKRLLDNLFARRQAHETRADLKICLARYLRSIQHAKVPRMSVAPKPLRLGVVKQETHTDADTDSGVPLSATGPTDSTPLTPLHSLSNELLLMIFHKIPSLNDRLQFVRTCRFHHILMCRDLYTSSVPRNLRSSLYDTDLHLILFHDNEPALRQFLDARLPIDHRFPSTSVTLLSHACSRLAVSCVGLLLARNASLAMPEDAGSILHALFGSRCLHSKQEGSEEYTKAVQILRMLLAFGADIHKTDRDGRTPLDRAVVLDSRMVRLLLEAGASANEGPKKFREYPSLELDGRILHRAVGYGSPYTIEMLLENGAELNATETSRITPLCYCLLLGNPQKNAAVVLDYSAKVGGGSVVKTMKLAVPWLVDPKGWPEYTRKRFWETVFRDEMVMQKLQEHGLVC